MWLQRQMIYLFKVLLKYDLHYSFSVPQTPDSFPSVFNILRTKFQI